MLYREKIAVCSEIHTKHINTLCGQNVEFLNVKNLVVHIVTTELGRVEMYPRQRGRENVHWIRQSRIPSSGEFF